MDNHPQQRLYIHWVTHEAVILCGSQTPPNKNYQFIGDVQPHEDVCNCKHCKNRMKIDAALVDVNAGATK